LTIQITIRDVPESVRDELAARAALQGRSMQEFLRIELERLPTPSTQEKARDTDAHLSPADHREQRR